MMIKLNFTGRIYFVGHNIKFSLVIKKIIYYNKYINKYFVL